LFLDFDPAAGERRDVHAVAVDLLHGLGGKIRKRGHESRLEEERRRVLEFLTDTFTLAGRSAVIYSCTPRRLWEVFQLQVRTRPMARFAERPILAPLAALLDDHERYAVALVDKDRARLLQVFLGRVEHEADVIDKNPGRSEMGGWAQARYSRHREEHLHAHLVYAAQQLQSESRRRPFDRLLVGGPSEARAAFLAVLPRNLRTRVAGTFSAELFLSEQEIINRVEAHEAAVEREGEVRFISDVLDTAMAGGPATLGWDETLQALGEGRVHKLVAVEGELRKGAACPVGHLAVVESIPTCPVCRTGMEPVDDLGEWAVERAFDTGSRVELVSGEGAQDFLTKAGGVGSLLRY
jgi:peptide chain release factor subunit 1